jgi:hypothetical protein
VPIYILCTLSIKYYVHQLFGNFPPMGADQGVMSMIDTPLGRRIARSAGIDPDDLKNMQ